MSKASLILLITSGFNLTRSFGFFPHSFTLFILSIRLYLRWNFQIQEFTEYTNFDNCLEYLEDRMIKLGPFDGLIGFSQVIISTFQFASTVSDFCTLFQIPNLIFAGCNFVWGFTRTAS